MINYTFSTILCPGGAEVVLFYFLMYTALAVAPVFVGVCFIVALIKLVKEGSK